MARKLSNKMASLQCSSRKRDRMRKIWTSLCSPKSNVCFQRSSSNLRWRGPIKNWIRNKLKIRVHLRAKITEFQRPLKKRIRIGKAWGYHLSSRSIRTTKILQSRMTWLISKSSRMRPNIAKICLVIQPMPNRFKLQPLRTSVRNTTFEAIVRGTTSQCLRVVKNTSRQ